MPEAKLEVLISARDEASKVLTGIQGRIEGMSKQLKIAGGIMAGSGVVIAGAMGLCLKAAAEEEAGITRLSVAMGNMGIQYDDVRDSLEAWISTQQTKTAIADDAQRDALSQLIRMTGNVEAAQDKLTLAMDIAAGTGRDLAGANTMVMYAMGGNWGMVERYIPALKNAQTEEEKWMLLRKMFAGQAEAYGKTTAGQMQLLVHNIGDVKEAIGDILIKAIQPLTKSLSPILAAIKDWIARNPELVKWLVIGTAAVGALLIPLGTFLIMLPLLAAGIGTLTAVSSPWLLIIGAVVAALALLVAGGVLVYKNWEEICSWCDKVRDWFVKLLDVIEGKLLAVLDWLREKWEFILLAIFPIGGAIALLIKHWDDLIGMIKKVCSWLMELRDACIDLVKRGIDWLRERLLKLIDPLETAWDWVSKLIGGSPGIMMLEEEMGTLGELLPTEQFKSFGETALAPTLNLITQLIEQTELFAESLLSLRGIIAGTADLIRDILFWSLKMLGEQLRTLINKTRTLIDELNAIPRDITITITRIEEAARAVGVARGIVGGAPTLFPSYQRGGIMPYTGLAYLHRGEVILPANTVINIPIYLDGELIAERIIEHAGDKARLRGY